MDGCKYGTEGMDGMDGKMDGWIDDDVADGGWMDDDGGDTIRLMLGFIWGAEE